MKIEKLRVEECLHIFSRRTCFRVMGQRTRGSTTTYAVGWGASEAEAIEVLKKRLFGKFVASERTCWEQPDEWWRKKLERERRELNEILEN